jgi:hypothetical protein
MGHVRTSGELEDDLIHSMGRAIAPDAIEGSLPKIMTVDPIPEFDWGAIGIKWVTEEGQYGEVLYLPPLVYRFFKAALSGDPPLRMRVERDGSISEVSGGPLEEPVKTAPTICGCNVSTEIWDANGCSACMHGTHPTWPCQVPL